MKSPKEYAAIVNDAIKHIEYPAWLPGLYDPIRYTMEGSGKRLRPTLLLASNEAFGGNVDDCVWPAVGIEIFHNFTLVHDDVMDNADMRRGRMTVHKKWDVNTAILSGDAMVSMAFKCMAGCPSMFLPEVIDRFGMMTMNVYEGQQIDADFEASADNVTFQQYLQMVMGKTSALIAYPCAIGAVIAGASPKDIDLIFNYGISLGIAFQMQDDYLDVYGDPVTFGKEIGGDIANNKKTWLYIMATDHDSDGAFKQLATKDINREEKIKCVTAAYDALDLREEGRKIVERYTCDALDFIKNTSMSDDAKQWFADFAYSLIGRNK